MLFTVEHLVDFSSVHLVEIYEIFVICDSLKSKLEHSPWTSAVFHYSLRCLCQWSLNGYVIIFETVMSSLSRRSLMVCHRFVLCRAIIQRTCAANVGSCQNTCTSFGGTCRGTVWLAVSVTYVVVGTRFAFLFTYHSNIHLKSSHGSAVDRNVIFQRPVSVVGLLKFFVFQKVLPPLMGVGLMWCWRSQAAW